MLNYKYSNQIVHTDGLGLVWFMVLNITFNNISVILWQSVLLVEENGVLGNTTNLSQVTDKLYHIMLWGLLWSGS
jgi:hypothetical protein